MSFDYQQIVKAVLKGYQLPPFGRHGMSHWARVWEGGLRVARISGADIHIVKLFSLFHDSKRENEALDAGHGRRGAEFAKSLRASILTISDSDFDLLYYACAYHTDGMTEADITVQTCWDADRLDLGRIGVRPDPQYLCTDAAKSEKIIDWSFKRSTQLFVPDLIKNEWGLSPDKQPLFNF